jgi:hypothetical protein
LPGGEKATTNRNAKLIFGTIPGGGTHALYGRRDACRYLTSEKQMKCINTV